MAILDDLRSLSSAEDFFARLDVAYDPAVLNVARLHILRRMGDYLRGAGLEGLDDAEAESRCRDTLGRAYEDFVSGSPLEHRVFKVLKDALAPPARAFVPLSDLTDGS